MSHLPGYDLVDVQEAAKIAGIVPHRIYNMIHRGVLASETRGGRKLVPRHQVQAYADERRRRMEKGLPLRVKYDLTNLESAPARPVLPEAQPKDETLGLEPPKLKSAPPQAPAPALPEKTNVAIAFEQAAHKQPVAPIFAPTPATTAPVAPTAQIVASPLATLKERLRHELGAVRHQASGIDEQIKKLENRQLELMAQEEEFVKRLAQIDDLEKFAHDFI